ELVAHDELLQQACVRECALAQLRERPLAAVALGRAPEHERPDAIDELLVCAGRRLEPRVEVSLHGLRLDSPAWPCRGSASSSRAAPVSSGRRSRGSSSTRTKSSRSTTSIGMPSRPPTSPITRTSPCTRRTFSI